MLAAVTPPLVALLDEGVSPPGPDGDRPMNGSTQSAWHRYGSAVVAVLLANLLCLLLDFFVESHLYYLCFSLALVFTGWHAGFRPCLVCFALSVPVLVFFFVPPRYVFAVHGTANHLGLMAYCLVGLAVLLYTTRLAGVELLVARQQERQRAAREIQQAQLPKASPQVAGFEVRGRAVFAEDVGGDCFDYIPVVAGGGECVVVMVCDAVGHGMASALLVTQVRAFVRVLAATRSDVGRMLRLANSSASSRPPAPTKGTGLSCPSRSRCSRENLSFS
jgi:hypothetical protein